MVQLSPSRGGYRLTDSRWRDSEPLAARSFNAATAREEETVIAGSPQWAYFDAQPLRFLLQS